MTSVVTQEYLTIRGTLADASCQVIPPPLQLAEIPVDVLPQALPPLLMQRDLNLAVPVISLWATEACKKKAFVKQPVSSKKAFALAKTIPMLPPKLPCKPCSTHVIPVSRAAASASLSDESDLPGLPPSSSAAAVFGPPALFRCNLSVKRPLPKDKICPVQPNSKSVALPAGKE